MKISENCNLYSYSLFESVYGETQNYLE